MVRPREPAIVTQRSDTSISIGVGQKDTGGAGISLGDRACLPLGAKTERA